MTGDGFTKLFSSILTSSIWSEDNNTRILWITILACTDKDGFCQASVPGLAAVARLSVLDTAAALAKLEAPDPYSRTQDYDGRRIQKTDGGWMVLNHGKYRDRERVERRREYQADLMRERRAKEAAKVLTSANNLLTGANTALTGANPSVSVSASASASASGSDSGSQDPISSVNTDKNKRVVFTPPTIEQVRSFASGDPCFDANSFMDYYQSNGWMVGKNKMRDWQATVRRWIRINKKMNQQQPNRPPILTTEERRAIAAARGA